MLSCHKNGPMTNNMRAFTEEKQNSPDQSGNRAYQLQFKILVLSQSNTICCIELFDGELFRINSEVHLVFLSIPKKNKTDTDVRSERINVEYGLIKVPKQTKSPGPIGKPCVSVAIQHLVFYDLNQAQQTRLVFISTNICCIEIF